MVKQLSDQQRKKLSEGFKSLKPTPPGQIGSKTSIDDFCDNWPDTRSLLVFLASLPGVSDDVKDAIGKVIAAGDLASSIIC